jgi:hypothetical protein
MSATRTTSAGAAPAIVPAAADAVYTQLAPPAATAPSAPAADAAFAELGSADDDSEETDSSFEFAEAER